MGRLKSLRSFCCGKLKCKHKHKHKLRLKSKLKLKVNNIQSTMNDMSGMSMPTKYESFTKYMPRTLENFNDAIKTCQPYFVELMKRLSLLNTNKGIGSYTRKSVFDMTNTEATNFVNAWRSMCNDGVIYIFVQIHSQMGVHQDPHFLPWHRGFISFMEAFLQANGSFLPYWPSDTNRKYPIWCGRQTIDVIDDQGNSAYPPNRRANPYNAPNSTQVTNALSDTVFSTGGNDGDFGFDLENYHNNVHGAVGGRNGYMSFIPQSPVDMIFYLHHANIDRIWNQWQQNNKDYLTDDIYLISTSDITEAINTLNTTTIDSDSVTTQNNNQITYSTQNVVDISSMILPDGTVGYSYV
jgi:hypothetical protein